MFMPSEDEGNELQLALSLPTKLSFPNVTFISSDELNEETLKPSLDALFISVISVKNTSALTTICEDRYIECVIFDHVTRDSAVINDVLLNLVDKLFSKTMPNNIDFADVRYINESSDHLFTFNNKDSALDFLNTQKLGTVVGGIHLANGDTSLVEYESTNNELLHFFSSNAFLCSSIHNLSHSECAILLGIKVAKEI